MIEVSLITEFIQPGDPRWIQHLEAMPHDFYHLPEYVELCAKDEGATAAAFYAEEGQSTFLVPLLIRSLPPELGAPSDWYDCVSPYGYPSPLIWPSQKELSPFLDAFCQAARRRNIITAFFRLHPLLPLDHRALGNFGQLIRHGQTVYIDLAQPKEALWNQVSTNHQRNIKKLVRLGFRVSIDEWSRLPDFVSLYHATMRRVDADDAYFFSREYFEVLRTKLAERLHLLCVLTDTNEVAAAGLVVVTDGIVQYHLGGTAAPYFSLAPSKLMIDFMWRWAQEGSHRILHLGGGVGGTEDSLFHFKAGFSSARGEFYTYRVVMDEEKNARLHLAAKSVQRISGLEPCNFFPRYRYSERQCESRVGTVGAVPFVGRAKRFEP
jgi:hypothetical protein